jgi:predicted PurR-regulated permease PerM
MTLTITSVIKKILLLFLVIAGLVYAKAFLMPLVIGGILATLFLPFCNRMEQKKIPKGIAVTVCFLTLLLIIALLVSLLSWKILELTNDVATIKQKGTEMFSSTQEYIFNHLGISSEEQMQMLKAEQFSYGTVMKKMIGSITSVVTNFILVLVYFLFLLFYRSHIKHFLLKLTIISQRNEVEQIIWNATNISQQYLVGLSKMIFCLWIMYGIGFSLLGVENAIFFAVLCGLLEIVPFVGNLTGATLTLLVSALHGGSPAMLGGILITYQIVQTIQGWILEPLILGPQVKINPLFTIIALVLGQLIWGIPGIILAIPMTAIFKIICDYVEPLKPYGFLIGEIETKKIKLGVAERVKMTLLKWWKS